MKPAGSQDDGCSDTGDTSRQGKKRRILRSYIDPALLICQAEKQICQSPTLHTLHVTPNAQISIFFIVAEAGLLSFAYIKTTKQM